MLPWLIGLGRLQPRSRSFDGVLIAAVAGARHGRVGLWTWATIVGAGVFSAAIAYTVHAGAARLTRPSCISRGRWCGTLQIASLAAAKDFDGPAWRLPGWQPAGQPGIGRCFARCPAAGDAPALERRISAKVAWSRSGKGLFGVAMWRRIRFRWLARTVVISKSHGRCVAG